MNNVENKSVQGSRQKRGHGLAKRIYVCALSAALLLAALAPTPVRADSAAISQLQYLQWVAQLSGASGQFSHNSSVADYVRWAQSQGLNPTGGWQPNSTLTKGALQQLLVQQFGLNQGRFGGDFGRTLLREGIDTSGVGDNVTKDHLVSLLDQLAVISRFPAAKNGPLHPTTPIKVKDRGDEDDRKDKDKDRDDHPVKVIMCHKGHTIRVSQKAVAAHLAHGDTLGTCHVTRHGHDRDDDDDEHEGHEGHDR